jgi:hypothetical protein
VHLIKVSIRPRIRLHRRSIFTRQNLISVDGQTVISNSQMLPRFGGRLWMEELFQPKKGFFHLIFLEKEDNHHFQWV